VLVDALGDQHAQPGQAPEGGTGSAIGAGVLGERHQSIDNIAELPVDDRVCDRGGGDQSGAGCWGEQDPAVPAHGVQRQGPVTAKDPAPRGTPRAAPLRPVQAPPAAVGAGGAPDGGWVAVQGVLAQLLDRQPGRGGENPRAGGGESHVERARQQVGGREPVGVGEAGDVGVQGLPLDQVRAHGQQLSRHAGPARWSQW